MTTKSAVRTVCGGPRIFTQTFTADMLADQLEKTLIDQLIQIVEERTLKGN